MLPLTLALVRGWTWLITRGTAPDECDRRRQEIESDLWEFEHDANRGDDMSAALRVLVRLILGIPHDVAWRMDRATVRRVAARSAIGLATLAAVLAVFIGQALRPAMLPAVNPAPPLEILTLHKRTPPVPPPPPPLKRKDMREPDWASLLMRIHETVAEKATDTVR